MSNLSHVDREALGLQPKLSRDDIRIRAQNAAAIVNRSARDARKIPDGYESADALLLALDARRRAHPSGLAGVARELKTKPKNVWRWLHQTQLPSEDTMRRMANVLTVPLPDIEMPAIDNGIPLPPIVGRGSWRKGKWRLVVEALKIGDSFLCPYMSTQNIRSQAKSIGIKISGRAEGLKHFRFWRIE
jgi:hypothetical protein